MDLEIFRDQSPQRHPHLWVYVWELITMFILAERRMCITCVCWFLLNPLERVNTCSGTIVSVNKMQCFGGGGKDYNGPRRQRVLVISKWSLWQEGTRVRRTDSWRGTRTTRPQWEPLRPRSRPRLRLQRNYMLEKGKYNRIHIWSNTRHCGIMCQWIFFRKNVSVLQLLCTSLQQVRTCQYRDADRRPCSAQEIKMNQSYQLGSCYFLEINSSLFRMSMIGCKSGICSIDCR